MEPVELKRKIKGIVNFLVTPYAPRDWKKLNEDGLRNNTRFLNENSVDVLVPCGGIGEITQLTLEEHKKAIEAVVEESSKSLVIPGVGPGTKRAIEVGRYAEMTGAEGVLVFPPPWTSSSEEGIYRHIKAVANSVKIGVMVIKSRESNLSAGIVSRLAKTKNIVAIKFEPGGDELGQFNSMVQQVGHKVAWVVNAHHTDQLATYFYMAGADAFMDAISNFAPKLDMEMYDALVRKDYDRAKTIQLMAAKIARLIEPIGLITLVKEAMNIVGLAGGSFRPPTLRAPLAHRKQIKEALQELKLQ